MFTTTLILAALAADAKPPQAPRPPQFPAAGAVAVKCGACGIANCPCGCLSGEVCRCAVAQQLPVRYYVHPVYQPVFFGGCAGGG